MNLIQSTVLTSLPTGKKKTPSGWIAFNAPCCIHHGETRDKRKRGGIMNSPDGTLSFHCFNCGFKTSYIPGRKISLKTKKWMSWLGIGDTAIKKLIIEALRLEESDNVIEKKKFITFKKKELPKNSHKLEIWLEKYLKKDLTDRQHQCIDRLLNYLKDSEFNGIINFECIGQNIIEIHLRISPQMAALYGEQNIKQIPGLYSDGVWKKDPDKKKPPGGYVLPLFVEDSPKHGYEINQQIIEDIASDENMRHVSLEYDGEKDLNLIAHPPGGYYIGSITVKDLDQGKEEKQRLLDAFVPRA